MPPFRKSLLLLFLILVLVVPVLAQVQSVCGVTTLYFQHNFTTTPAGYEELINYPSGNPEVDESVTVINTGGTVLIDNYIMPVGSLSNTIELEPGLRTYQLYSYVNTNPGVTRLNFTAFRRFANGTEQNFYTAMSPDIDATVVTAYDMTYVSSTTLQLNPTDRLGIRVSANTTHSAPVVVHFVYQGSTHTSHFESGFFVCEAAAAAESVSVYQPSVWTPVGPEVAVLGAAVGVGIVGLRGRKRE